MLGFSKTTKDVPPITLFRQELAKVVAAARFRKIFARTIASELEETAAVIWRNDAVNYAPTKIYSGNLPE